MPPLSARLPARCHRQDRQVDLLLDGGRLTGGGMHRVSSVELGLDVGNPLLAPVTVAVCRHRQGRQGDRLDDRGADFPKRLPYMTMRWRGSAKDHFQVTHRLASVSGAKG
jgi:hypothetical protein